MMHFKTKDYDNDNHHIKLRLTFLEARTRRVDPLCRHHRTPAHTKIILEGLFAESLSSVSPTPSPTKKLIQNVFNDSDLCRDSILNWHLHIRFPEPQYYNARMDRGTNSIVPPEDAAHSLPEALSEGAHIAIEDVASLAEAINIYRQRHQIGARFIQKRDDAWLKATSNAVQALRRRHGLDPLKQAELRAIIGVPLADSAHRALKHGRDGASDLDSRCEQRNKI